MAAGSGRAALVRRYVRAAGEMGLTGSIALDRTAAAIYFDHGAPRHAVLRSGDHTVEGDEALRSMLTGLVVRDGPVAWRTLEAVPRQTMEHSALDLLALIDRFCDAAASAPPMPAAAPVVEPVVEVLPVAQAPPPPAPVAQPPEPAPVIWPAPPPAAQAPRPAEGQPANDPEFFGPLFTSEASTLPIQDVIAPVPPAAPVVDLLPPPAPVAAPAPPQPLPEPAPTPPAPEAAAAQSWTAILRNAPPSPPVAPTSAAGANTDYAAADAAGDEDGAVDDVPPILRGPQYTPEPSPFGLPRADEPAAAAPPWNVSAPAGDQPALRAAPAPPPREVLDGPSDDWGDAGWGAGAEDTMASPPPWTSPEAPPPQSSEPPAGWNPLPELDSLVPGGSADPASSRQHSSQQEYQLPREWAKRDAEMTAAAEEEQRKKGLRGKFGRKDK